MRYSAGGTVAVTIFLCSLPGHAQMTAPTPQPQGVPVTPEQAASVIQLQSLQRRILPEDIARTCVFLGTEWSDGITGQTINVDGGWVMH